MTANDRRRQILDVALTAFSRAGYHATSMTDIADALHLTKPVVYQHFDSKRALYLELLRDVGDDLLAHVTRAAAGTGDPRAQVELGMVAYFTWVHDNTEAFRLLFESSPRVDDEFADIVNEFELGAARAISPFIAVDAPGDRVLTIAMGLVGLAETVSRHVIRDGARFDPAELAHTVSSFAWAGLRAAGQSRSTQPR